MMAKIEIFVVIESKAVRENGLFSYSKFKIRKTSGFEIKA